MSTRSEMTDLPLVSAIMITGKDDCRYRLARLSLASFKAQTYPNRELVIVNDHPEFRLSGNEPNIREIVVERDEKRTLGDLRNIGLDHARGDLIMQFDDDDWSHPSRMSCQVQEWRPGHIVTLRYQIRYSTVNRTAFYFKGSRTGIHGTILHERTDHRYPSMTQAEDTAFLRSFKRVRAIGNRPGNPIGQGPELYVRFHHGHNTWHAEHIMKRMAKPKRYGTLSIRDEHKEMLAALALEFETAVSRPE